MPLTMTNQWVTLANRALARIGTQQISSLTDGSTPALYCNNLLPEVVQSVYGQFDWKSARKRIELSALVDAPLYGYDYAYQLPNDFMRIIATEDAGPFEIEGHTLLSDEEDMFITYIGYPIEADKIPGPIAHLIVTYLAFLLSTPLTSNEGMAQRLLGEYQLSLEQAKKDDNAGRYQEPATGFYEDVR